MKKTILFISFIFAIIFLSMNVISFENSMKLLAVKELGNGEYEGDIAELTLKTIPGDGKVLLETTPLTKIDTQLSTRMAKEIACDFLKINCNNYDFIYTIKSASSIVGGPSAGSAMAIITVATLDNVKLDEDIAITGTINSGGIIGPVGGIKSKIKAAFDNGIKKVLIPKGSIINEKLIDEMIENSSKINQTDNSTINSTTKDINNTDSTFNYSKYNFKEVATLNDAMTIIVNHTYIHKTNKNVSIDEEYFNIMKNITTMLCNRTTLLLTKIDENQTKYFENVTKEYLQKIENGKYYSAASKCFSTNIALNSLISKNITFIDIAELESEILIYENEINEKNIKTVPKFQTFIIVKERINEALKHTKSSHDALIKNDTQMTNYFYSYSKERFESAKAWSLFFNKKGKELDFNNEVLKNACLNKIEEANERTMYLKHLFGNKVKIDDNINRAKKEYEKKEYALCLNYASLAKAEADTIMSSSGISNEQSLRELVKLKLDITRENIIHEQTRDLFPILAYSYYEYSENLIEENIYSSLLFSQYSLELSNFDTYLKIDEYKDNEIEDIIFSNNSTNSNYEMMLIYLFGIISGVIITYMVKD